MITSKVQTANKTSGSLRATIPIEVVEAMGLVATDVIAWEILDAKDKMVVKIRKLE
jgi:hypothetical protein